VIDTEEHTFVYTEYTLLVTHEECRPPPLQVIPHATHRVDVGGTDVTDEMARVLATRGISFLTPSSTREVVDDMKERGVAFVSPSAEEYVRKMT
jgi:hypothetical protein